MTAKLERSLKRELSIRGKPYTLVVSPERLHLAPKGRRKGYDLAWVDLISGDAALATALNASLKWAEPAGRGKARSQVGTVGGKKSRPGSRQGSKHKIPRQ